MAKPKTQTAAYAVGYKKPPKQTQFKPGQSGNPKGKAKTPPSFLELMTSQAAKTVTVKVDGVTKTLPQLSVVVTALYRKAMSGDLAAAKLVMHALAQAADTAGPTVEPPLSAHEIALLADLIDTASTAKGG